MAFRGFPKQALEFFEELEANNNRDWFQAHRRRYDEYVMEPSKDFVVAVGDRLAKVSADVVAEPRVNGSIRRINRDTRFSKDKTPYKTRTEFMFSRGEGKPRPAYWFGFSPDSMGVGAGMWGFDDRLLKEWRQSVDDDATGGELARTLAKLSKAGFDVYGEHYKRVPKPYDANHPRADLLRHAGLHVSRQTPVPAALHGKELVTLVMKDFRKLAPLTDWLVRLADG